MKLQIKRFAELTNEELYHLLRLRVSVFVVEQNCPYQELDGRDLDALHIWLEDEDGICAYLRVMDRDAAHEAVTIGRVLSVRRRMGLGSRVLAEGIRAAREIFGADRISLEAQVYARALYEKQGFRQISEEFLEDGIPHIRMLLECPRGQDGQGSTAHMRRTEGDRT